MRNIQQVPKDWTLKRLDEVADFVNGGTPSRNVPEYFRGTIPWITSNDIRSFRTSQARECITAEAIQNSATHLVPRGSVLLDTRTAIGKVSIADVDICISQDLTGLIIKNGIAEPEYLARFLSSISEDLKHRQRGSTIKGLTRDFIAELLIPLPPLPLQQQIAAILEKADAAREKRRQANQLTEQFLQSAFLEMFGDPATNPKGWERIEAQKLFEIKLGKMLDEKQYTGKHLRPYLRNVNVQWGKFDLSDIKEMDFEPDDFEKYKLRRGDILVCEGGEVGRCAIGDEQIKDCCYQKALHRLRIINPIIETSYFIYFVRAAAKLGLLVKDTSQVTIAHFTAEKFREFKVLIPPLHEQQKFAALVEKVESLRAKQRQSEQELEHLFHSLMQRAFRGELVGEANF